jgi:hypothetical protein
MQIRGWLLPAGLEDDLDFISVVGVRQVVYAKKALWLGERLKAVTALQHRTSGDGQKRQ